MTPGELPSLTSWPALAAYALGLAYLVWHGWAQARRTKDVAAVADKIDEQVSNSHSTNLREELDDRHSELLTTLSEMRVTLGHIDLRTARIGTEVIRDRKDFDKFREDAYGQLRDLKGIAAKHHPKEG